MRWRTANNNRRKAEREWQRTGKWRALWPGLAETYAKIADYTFADMIVNGPTFPMRPVPYDISLHGFMDNILNSELSH